MSRISAILLSIALTLFSSEAAFAQYQDSPFAVQDPRFTVQDPHFAAQNPRYVGQDTRYGIQNPLNATQSPYYAAQDPASSARGLAGQFNVHDGLDDIYNQINALAEQRPISDEKPVRDKHAYNQFMAQTADDLSVERLNTARFDAARRRDAIITGAYEQKRINDTANWEKSQLQGSSQVSRRGRNVYIAPGNVPADNNNTNNDYYFSGGATAANMQNVDDRRRVGLSQSQDAIDSRLRDSQALAGARDQAMDDVANSLRDQVLSTQSSKNKFGLQGVGTNLYVRQYGRPEANLPPVHNAAARIVPRGED